MTEKHISSILFEKPVLVIIDNYAAENDLSRNKAVMRMCKEFIRNNNLDPDNTIGFRKAK